MACTPSWLHREEEASKPSSCLPACLPCVCGRPPIRCRSMSESYAPPHCPWLLEPVGSASPVRLLLGLALPGKRQW